MDNGAAEPVKKSLCGTCNKCTNACPAQAITGNLQHEQADRDEIFDAIKCREQSRILSQEKMQKEITLCGKCIEVCPYTKKYISSEG